MPSFDDVSTMAIDFRNARDWKQFHNPKDLAISISLEASELLELFQWSGTDLHPKDAAAARDELADIMIYCIYFADALGIDIPAAIADKLKENEERYPISKAKGSPPSTPSCSRHSFADGIFPSGTPGTIIVGCISET